jgi:hypothetical protein
MMCRWGGMACRLPSWSMQLLALLDKAWAAAGSKHPSTGAVDRAVSCWHSPGCSHTCELHQLS